MCIYVYITLQRECDVFDLEWNVLRIRALYPELPTEDPLTALIFLDPPCPLF